MWLENNSNLICIYFHIAFFISNFKTKAKLLLGKAALSNIAGMKKENQRFGRGWIPGREKSRKAVTSPSLFPIVAPKIIK